MGTLTVLGGCRTRPIATAILEEAHIFSHSRTAQREDHLQDNPTLSYYGSDFNFSPNGERETHLRLADPRGREALFLPT